MNIRPVWAELFHADGQTCRSYHSFFHKFANMPKKEKTLIDVAIPADRNVVQKEAEKKLKYKSLCRYRDTNKWNLLFSLFHRAF